MSEAPAWARGFDLAFLREMARLFKAELGPHCYGAFGLPKERDVADAHAEHGAIWTRDKLLKGEPLVAAALFRRLRSGSTHEDFAGRKAKLQAGDVIVRAVAGSEAGKRRLLERLLERAGGAVWVEGHVENDELVALLSELGFGLAMTKIAASSDLKGLWLQGGLHPSGFAARLPKPLEPADIPALAILQPDFIAEEEAAAILAEAEQFASWADHYSGYNKGRSWSAYSLQGFDPQDPSFIIKPAEMSKAWKAENSARLGDPCGPTIAAEHFPAALAAAARIPGEKQRIRLMRLAPQGGELTRHADITDPEAGTGPGKVARLHIPLRTSPACRFSGWGLDGAPLERHFPERALCYLDTRKPHAARNDGGAERVHLVVDTFASPQLRTLIGLAG